MTPRLNDALKGALKGAVGLALIGVLLHRADPAAVWRTMAGAAGAALAAGVMGYVTATVFEVLKLHVALGAVRPLSFTARLVFAGLFCNTFLPANVGGDAYRILALKGRGDTLGEAVLPVLLDRTVGVTVLFAAGAATAVARGGDWTARAAVRWQGAGAHLGSAVGVGAALVLGVVLLLALRPGLRARIGGRLAALLGELRTAWRRVRPGTFGLLFGGALAFHAGRVTGVWFFLKAFGVQVPWPDVVTVLAAVALASSVPVSIGALGVREGALTAMLVLLGVTPPVALAVALLNLGVLWTKALIGGVWLLTPVGLGRGAGGT